MAVSKKKQCGGREREREEGMEKNKERVMVTMAVVVALN